jgi:Protein of unknown function (DUF3237)
MTRRSSGRLCGIAAGAALAALVTARPASGAEDEPPRTEFLVDLVLEKGPASDVGSQGTKRVVVMVTGGTFEGPRLKGTIVGPSGDWIVARPDGTSVLDIRAILQTDDGQRISMTCRGLAYTQPDGTLYARILPLFETGASKYAWLNNLVAVGVYRPAPGKVAYRIYRIL